MGILNKAAIIDSGLLELYVIGEADAAQIKLVESNLHIQEVKEELDRIERNLEKMGFEEAVEVPEHVNQKIMKAIKSTPSESCKGKKEQTANMYHSKD